MIEYPTRGIAACIYTNRLRISPLYFHSSSITCTDDDSKSKAAEKEKKREREIEKATILVTKLSPLPAYTWTYIS